MSLSITATTCDAVPSHSTLIAPTEWEPLREKLIVSDILGEAVKLSDPLRLSAREGMHVGDGAMDALPLPVGEPVGLLVSAQDPILVTPTAREPRLLEVEGVAVSENVTDLLTVQLKLLDTVEKSRPEPLPVHVLVYNRE